MRLLLSIFCLGVTSTTVIGGTIPVVRFYIAADQPASQFPCWEEVPGTQPVGVPGTCKVGDAIVGRTWNPAADLVRAGELVELIVVTKQNDTTQYTAAVTVKALQELSQVRSGAAAPAANAPGFEATAPKLIEIVLGVWTGSSIVTVQASRTGSDGKPVAFFGDSFSVHRFYRANVGGGFLVSTLHTREYGAMTLQEQDSAGNPVTSGNGPVFITVPTVGPVRRPQLHPYVGVNWYFKEQDFFPGSERKWRPNWMFGAVVDETQSYITGLSLETFFGLTLGVGTHLGREQFLAAGVTPGKVPAIDGTHLPDASKPPPVVNRQRVGAFFSVGFDLSLFKSVFGGPIGLK